MKATWLSKRGCQESLFQINKQTLGKEKARKRKNKEPKIIMFAKKGLMDKQQRKNEKENQKENRIGRKEGF